MCCCSHFPEIVRRIRAMATKLLPVEVEISDISDATSSIITPEVIDAFSKCGGDFIEAVPYWYTIKICTIFKLKSDGQLASC